MKRIIKSLSIVLIVFGIFFTLTGCDNSPEAQQKAFEDEMNEKYKTLYFALKACTGTCLKREEMAQLVYDYEKVQERYSGQTVDAHKHITYPELQLITPGKHEHDENTRYEITLLDTDENGFHKGLEVKVMSDTSGCKIEEPEPQLPTETTETTETVSGLPAKDIAGSYTAASLLKVNMKGKDEDEPWTEIYSEEFTVTYNISAVDEKTVRIDIETTKFGEGPYDPATGICEFKIAPEFYEAMPNAKHDDFIRRVTFSRKGDKIQFEMIVVSQDEDSVTIGIKNE